MGRFSLRRGAFDRYPLLLWVFLVNGAVLAVAAVLLAVTPITISASIAVEQLALLVVGLMLLLAVDFLLLRRLLAPLTKLAEVMSSVHPERPGQRLDAVTLFSSEGMAVASAFNAMLDRLERARRDAARASLGAQEAERARVARELHDEIGQTLTAIKIHADRAATGDPGRAREELARLSEAIQASLEEVRRVARELRPEALDDLGLVNALISLCTRVDAEGDMRVRRELQGRLPPLLPEVELVVYRVAQESLTNTLRHAEATTVTVSLSTDAETLTLTVADDGSGMPSPLPRGTAGIAGMRERALLIGASLSFESAPGRGTSVRLTVPLQEEDEA